MKINNCKCGAKAKVTGVAVECSSRVCNRCVQRESKYETIVRWNEINSVELLKPGVAQLYV